MDLVRTVRQAQGALVGIGACEAVILRHAAAAMGLDRIVDDAQTLVKELNANVESFLQFDR